MRRVEKRKREKRIRKRRRILRSIFVLVLLLAFVAWEFQPSIENSVVVKKAMSYGEAILNKTESLIRDNAGNILGESGEKEEDTEENQKKEEEEKSGKDSAEESPDKSETVYALTDAEGTVKEVTVTEVLKAKEGEEIKDKSDLDDIKNVNGDEEYTVLPDGTISWENLGKDIQYEGNSSRELPVSVKVSYYLNGVKTQPKDLAGKSGQVRIRFDYENKTHKTVNVGEDSYDVKVPFVVMTLIFLDPDVCSDIKVTNGKIMDLNGESVIVGYALPGLSDCLKLSEYEPTEDIDLPEYVEFTANVEDFSMEFSATVATPGLFSEIDEEDLDSGEDLAEAINDLNEASDQLVDGSGALLGGMSQFSSYLSQYVSGVNTMTASLKALGEGIRQLNDKKDRLKNGAESLEEGLNQINDILKQIEIPELDQTEGIENADQAIKELLEEAEALREELSTLNNQITQLEGFIEEVTAYKNAVETATATIREALANAGGEAATEELNEAAREQVRAALSESLSNTELSEEEKAAIIESAVGNIDLSGQIENTQQNTKDSINNALNALDQIPELTIPENNINTVEIHNKIEEMQNQLDAVLNLEDLLSEDVIVQLDELKTTFDTFKKSVEGLYDGSTNLSSGIEAYTKAIGEIYQGIESFGENTGTISEAGSALESGYSSIVSGASALSDGLSAFDEEGIKKMGDLAGEDLIDLLNRIRATKKADEEYTNYGGISDGQTGGVKFIIETEEIK